MWRHIQECGLQVAYINDDGTFKLLRKIMPLCFLPAQNTLPIFQRLQQKRSNDNNLNKLLKYISRTWINSVVWQPECWSIYYQSVRTNNDLEGWHNRPNYRGRAGMYMYNAGEVAPRGIVQDSSPSSACLPRKATATVLHSNY